MEIGLWWFCLLLFLGLLCGGLGGALLGLFVLHLLGRRSILLLFVALGGHLVLDGRRILELLGNLLGGRSLLLGRGRICGLLLTLGLGGLDFLGRLGFGPLLGGS